MKIIHILGMLLIALAVNAASPIEGLLERIDKGASRKFVIEQVKSPVDFFELDQKGDKVVIRGNNYVSIATGLNWYLKYHAGIHLSWNGMQAELPEVLPAVKLKERHETDMKYRYDFNYCTFSYTMAFWDWARWEKEIDWMALHGINLPLAMVGTDGVWFNVLSKLGYTKEEINEFIAGPGFQAWWLMNNLEGWGGPNPDSWYKQQIALQQQIVKRMREYGIEPVFPGYSGMVPHNAKEKLGLNVSDPGLWNGYRRPAFLQPTDPRFEEIASVFRAEGVEDFMKLPESVEACRKFAKLFSELNDFLEAAKVQGFTWQQREYSVTHDDGSVEVVRPELDERTYLILVQRYKELFAGDGEGHRLPGDDQGVQRRRRKGNARFEVGGRFRGELFKCPDGIR